MSLAELEPTKETVDVSIEKFIERKFEIFIDDLPASLPIVSTSTIEQLHLEAEAGEDYRVAQATTYDEFVVYELLITSCDVTARQAISQQEYLQLHQSKAIQITEFDRMNTHCDGQPVTIDTYFADSPDEIIIASVQFFNNQDSTARQQADRFNTPDWLSMEVTNDESLHGLNITPNR